MNRREFCYHTGKALLMLGMIPSAASSFAANSPGSAGKPELIAQAINALGLDLLSKGTASGENALLSPFSIQTAFAMTWSGADGATRQEMARVLHYPEDEGALQSSYQALSQALNQIAQNSARRSEAAKKHSMEVDPIVIAMANRLFGQQGYEFREAFLQKVNEIYEAPLQTLDFKSNTEAARHTINKWVEERTRQRIQDLIPPDGVDRETRLVLVNAIYLKAPWQEPFPADSTRKAPFTMAGGKKVEVPTMLRQGTLGYAKQDGYTAVTVPYGGGELQFLVLLPDAEDGLAALESRLTPEVLTRNGRAAQREVILHLPKFRLEPGVLRLSKALKQLGMRSAFDEPQGSANFDRMAPRRPNDYLYISEAFHKTFIEVDEKGTEAAAATAVAMARATAALVDPPKPVEVRVDHPFLFAVQHRASGACLFLGRLHTPAR